jgi:shikimate dehydrogenase
MKLALIGRDISHSRSPDLYRKLIGPNIVYDLLDFNSSTELPTLNDLAIQYDAVNITSPYKTHYLSKVEINDPMVEFIGAINTIYLKRSRPLATNTDLLAVRTILTKYKQSFTSLKLLILGGGVMARLCEIVAQELSLPMQKFSRDQGFDVEHLDLSLETKEQTIIINCCSRQFEFKGELNSQHIFWDLNYRFPPHEKRIPNLVKIYQDGQELLELQAKMAVQFWAMN